MRLALYGIILINCIQYLYAIEYIYPINIDQDNVTLLHQKSCNTTEILEWNIKTHRTTPLLWSIFNPTYCTILPDKSGFSFIDNGRLRIKYFNKRSPKSLDFDIPFLYINALQWIDENSCYCSAYLGSNFAILKLFIDGTVEIVSADKKNDYLYPCYCDENIFFIERKKDAVNNIIDCTILCKNMHMSIVTPILLFSNSLLVSLRMKSATEGFVLEYKNINDATYTFIYHVFYYDTTIWQTKKLFDFTIPQHLLKNDSSERIYESLLPFVPYHAHNRIYFVSSDANDTMNIFYYDTITQRTAIIDTIADKKCFFVPRVYNNVLLIGGIGASESDIKIIDF